MYDLCIVGAGCVGSAAARHASQWGSVCLIGPKEPNVRNLNNTRDIFGAHYDEGRITRSTDEDYVWSNLAQESIARYRTLEKSTGIKFYDEVGYIICGTKNSELIQTNKEYAKKYGNDTSYLTNKDLMERFPYLNFSEDDEALYENINSGYISPRRMIDAQIVSAKQNGCHVIEEVAGEVKRCVKDGTYVMCVTTDNGHQIYANKVLLATGAFTDFRNLLPSHLKVDVLLCPITVARIEISESDFTKIRNMPSISYGGTGGKDWKTKFKRLADNTARFYMLPPVKYPDGKYYIKLGHYWEDHPLIFTTKNEAKSWFCSGGDRQIIEHTVTLIQDIMKGITTLSYKSDCCIIVKTPSDRPYIDHIHAQLGVALGGNGCAAKSGDEIGRIAAGLIMRNRWDSQLPKDLFAVKFSNSLSKL